VKGEHGERLRGSQKTLAKKRALSRRALADLERWMSGGFAVAAE
jgi:methylenetetrahydrofolate--tRNA-(uracil-5-)-methyltransferase